MKMILSVFLLVCGFIGFSEVTEAQQSNFKLNQSGYYDAAIASGQTASSAVDVGGMTLVGYWIPAAFTGTTVSFQGSPTGINGTFYPIKDSTGTAISATVAAGQYNAVNHTLFYGIRYLKVVSGTAEGAARTVRLQLKNF